MKLIADIPSAFIAFALILVFSCSPFSRKHQMLFCKKGIIVASDQEDYVFFETKESYLPDKFDTPGLIMTLLHCYKQCADNQLVMEMYQIRNSLIINHLLEPCNKVPNYYQSI